MGRRDRRHVRARCVLGVASGREPEAGPAMKVPGLFTQRPAELPVSHVQVRIPPAPGPARPVVYDWAAEPDEIEAERAS